VRSVLVTGSEGLVGGGLVPALQRAGYEVRGYDLRGVVPAARADVLDPEALQRAARGCAGIVHLAAVSRVVSGEQQVDLCRLTNVDGTANVLRAARGQERPPWVLLASSREVYGQPGRLPADEDCPIAPVNAYGRSKAEAERRIADARAGGLVAAIVRLSNVYGSATDHADRVVPAFARAAARGAPVRIDGADRTFDFTHVDDVARGLVAIVGALEAGEARLPAIHLVTGRPTTLGRLAELAVAASGGRSGIRDGPPRSYDVARFWGDPSRARRLLDWSARVAIEDGLGRLVAEFRGLADQGPGKVP
jgi:nucleoside-diphosphate-sugar epimerase